MNLFADTRESDLFTCFLLFLPFVGLLVKQIIFWFRETIRP